MRFLGLKTILLISVLFMLVLSGCKSEQLDISEDVPVATQEVFAMDTFMTVTGYGDKCEEAVEAAVNEIYRLEGLFSVGIETSEVAILNRTGSVNMSKDTAVVIQQAMNLYYSTNGVFDISIYPLMELWGFRSDDFQVPSDDEIKAILKYVNASDILLDYEKNTVRILPNQGIDLGGIAKGYTSDRIMNIFEEYDLVSGMVSLGGNVQCYSGKTDGSPWKCGIQDPDNQDFLICAVSVKDKAVITSGGYERCFTDDTGKTWHHILDPRTGYSADSGLKSVTIISAEGMLADGLSTSVFIMGLDDAINYWREHQESFDMILVTEDRDIYVTEGITEDISCKEAFEIIKKRAVQN